MVQVLKDSIRNRIADAAEAQFAKVGFKNATIGAIAQDAGVATGTVYKYYPSKTALYQAILIEDFVQEFSRLTQKRIASFANPDGLDVDQNIMEGYSGELLRFYTRNRQKIIILLAWGEDTLYGNFAQKYIDEMKLQTMQQVQKQFPQLIITETFLFMVDKILNESVRGIVSILNAFDNELSIQKAFTVATKCQLATINTLIQFALQGEE